ncbi:uncharacterized protein LOC128212277 [Mya arenaria]|uniref:uncharacterized protein LOC128212277 n=1 Tax=Mya arenaria TaxID=6604 RepID=UPI0022E991CC|nr:uncharacterized protein LOC128212277 [Mya arenaria]
MEIFWTKIAVLIAAVADLATPSLSCEYIVESRRVSQRDLPPVRPLRHLNGTCEIPGRLRDRWTLLTPDRERLRIRSHSMTARYPGQTNLTRIRYRCLESRGHTFLLGTETSIGRQGSGVLCLGFAAIFGNSVVGEYSIVRLNAVGYESHLLGPQLLPRTTVKWPTLNDTCVQAADQKDYYAEIVRAERRCVFPDELHRTWNFTHHKARHVTFAEKTFTFTFMDGSVHKFDCNVKEGDIYVLREFEFTDGQDGVLCYNITRLLEDPHYNFEMSRLNSGDHMEGMVRLLPVGRPVELSEDCDWLESPARPEFLY